MNSLSNMKWEEFFILKSKYLRKNEVAKLKIVQDFHIFIHFHNQNVIPQQFIVLLDIYFL